MRRAAALAALLAAPALAGAQEVAANRATSYLHPTDVRDARALWVNPAGLGVLRDASVYAELAVANPGARGRLQQINAGFNARGLAFAYQRDVLSAGARGHTYRLGLAGASEGLAAGFAVALYRGDTKATGWDLGVVYDRIPALTVGGVIANIGQPVVRGLEQRLTFVPGVTWRPSPAQLGRAATLSAHARITADSVLSYAMGLGWQGAGRLPIGIFARLDTDGGLRRGAFAVGLVIGGADRVGAVVSTPGDLSGVDAASLYGLSTRAPLGARP
ncbi:MAG: hypothetical protein ACREMC_02910 [Gemmatimonadales bacterium]